MSKSSKKEEDSYTCTLSPEVQEKATKELNEDPKTRLLEVKNLRTRLEKVPGLQPRTDVKFLLRFLRARKFDQERTFQLVKNYYDIRLQSPDIFNDLKPTRVRGVFDACFIEVLEHRNNEGCRVIIFRPELWDPDKFPLVDVLKAVYVLLSKVVEKQKSGDKPALFITSAFLEQSPAMSLACSALMLEEETQVNGIHLISLMSSFSMKQATKVTPSLAKFFVNTIQDVLPLRLKRYDFVNVPTFFDVVFSLIKPFMKEKLLSRTILNGDKFDKLHTMVKPEFLPVDLGGKLPKHNNKEFIDSLLASDAQFEEDNKLGFVKMNVNSGTSVSRSGDADMQGLGGTFKKLDI